jgi:hypothetical protein
MLQALIAIYEFPQYAAFIFHSPHFAQTFFSAVCFLTTQSLSGENAEWQVNLG